MPPQGMPPGHPPMDHHHHGDRVPTTVDAGRESVVIERRITSEETMGRVVFVLPIITKTNTWEPVCVTPCNVELPRWSSYRVAETNHVTASREFTLPPNRPNIKLSVDPGNLQVHRLGLTLASAGTAALITGATLTIGAGAWDDETGVRTAGIITGGAGLLLLAIGIPIAIATQTHVDVDGTKLAKPKPQGPHLIANGVVF
jgi:hypothetical protein